MATTLFQEGVEVAPPIRLRNLIWVALALILMVAAIRSRNNWTLNFVHVMAGVLWTGIDLFMGFVVGPILRRVSLATRRAIIGRLVPKMLFLMPTLSAITGTAGYYLARQMGYLDIGYPHFWWVVAALTILVILTVQGLGLILPINLRIYFELRKPQPDGQRISRMMRVFIMGVAFQGLMQVAMIVVMARFVTGI